jgi:hypothetical protein
LFLRTVLEESLVKSAHGSSVEGLELYGRGRFRLEERSTQDECVAASMPLLLLLGLL